MMPTEISVSSTTFFHVAATFLHDATQWNRVAALNGLTDPWLSGVAVLLLPEADASAGGGIGPG